MNPPQCKICAEYWLKEGRPMGHYLIVSRGGHIPGVVHDSSSSEKTRAEAAAGTSEVPESEQINRLIAEVSELKRKVSINEINELNRKLSIKESGKGAQIAEPSTTGSRGSQVSSEK